jgi:hypothetical protein
MTVSFLLKYQNYYHKIKIILQSHILCMIKGKMYYIIYIASYFIWMEWIYYE